MSRKQTGTPAPEHLQESPTRDPFDDERSKEIDSGRGEPMGDPRTIGRDDRDSQDED